LGCRPLVQSAQQRSPAFFGAHFGLTTSHIEEETLNFTRRTAVTLAAAVFGSLAVAAPLAAADKATSVYREYVQGDPKAKVVVIEYASLTCPHCAHFAEEDFPKLKKDYIDTGKIKFVFRDFPLDGMAMGAALLARCAPGDRGKTMVDMMFKNQKEWMSNEKPLDILRGYAQLAGMDSADVDACLKNEAILKEINDVREKAMTIYKVKSTPSFFVGEQLVEGADYASLKKEIDKQLK
jgi:protein-disulfide isomerase